MPAIFDDGSAEPDPDIRGPLPLALRATRDGIDLATWAIGRETELEMLLRIHGGILFRGFRVEAVESFRRFSDVFVRRYMEDYQFPLTPREKIDGAIALASTFSSSAVLPLHGELDAQRIWPRTILFFCMHPSPIAARGSSGETSIADARRVLNRLAPATRQKFEALGIKYVRNIRGKSGLEYVFGTADRAEIESFCARHRYQVTFQGDDARTEHVAHAILPHPETGESVWFNHLQIYHQRSLPEALVRSTHAVAPGEPFPLEAYYGDGAAISNEVMREVRRAYGDETVLFFWQRGDVLLLDNMLVAHGRRPYAGERKVLVAMGNPHPEAADGAT